MSSAIQAYLQDISRHLKAGNATEHTHRPALQTLLQSILPDYHITNEPRRIACGAPDFEIAKGSEPIGHIEAKDVGIDLNKVQKSEQLARYTASLNNLLLTDYLEFRWFVNGEYKADMTVKLAELGKNGALKIYPEAFSHLENLLKSVVESQIITLRSPEELAKKMAHIARLMNDVLIKAYEQEDDNGKLHAQLSSFREVLIDTLSVEEFADMVAQTICYGLFTAKCSADFTVRPEPVEGLTLRQAQDERTQFSRLTAVHFVPKTNPFLRQFFNQLAGIELDERLVWMVEHLVAVLNRADIGAILADFGKRTRREDPVVHFYETFLANYDAKLREVRGVYYTPEPVVSYIVRSVDLILKNQFGLREGLADSSGVQASPANASKACTPIHKVQILDPATGTGTFLYAVIAQIYQQVAKKNKGGWSDYVSKHLLPRVHGFELLMAAYTVAHIKLSLQLKDYGYDFKSDERLRVFLTNTLDEAHGKQTTLLSEWLSNEANAASSVKRDSPVMVILGNPPYSGHSANTGAWISDLLRSAGTAANYFEVDGHSLNERNPKWLNDDYVKFIRFAHWRIMQTGYGVLAFVTNHGYLDNPTFRGMRQSLLQDFDEIYILDLHGNSKKKETAPDGSVDKNVFDIQQGVAIGIFIKKGVQASLARASEACTPEIYHAHCYGERQSKYQYLAEQDINTTHWTNLKPQAPFYLFVPQDTDLLPEYQSGWKVTEMMPVNVLGFQTHRDDFAIAFEKETIVKRMQDMRATDLSDNQFIEKYALKESATWQIAKQRKAIRSLENWQTKITEFLYHPFDSRYCFFSEIIVDRPRRELQNHVFNKENLCFLSIRQMMDGVPYSHFFASDKLSLDRSFACSRGAACIFPLYLYPTQQSTLFDHDPDHDTRKPNFSPAFIADLETRLQLTFIPEDKGDFEQTISALDVFHYLYAVFHSPTYRTRYAEFLKMDFPRLPLISDKTLFKQLAELGEQLVSLHLMTADSENDCCFPIEGDNLVEKIDYQDNKIYINKTQYFDHVTPELWAFHIGGYQVCQKWLKDRKGRQLSYDDCNQYLTILAALEHTQTLMLAIDGILVFPVMNRT